MEAIPDYFAFQEGREATVECAVASSIRHNVPANLLLAIRQAEGGKNGMVRKNRNGSTDHGTMQWNNRSIGDYRQYGITVHHVSSDGCYALDLAAYRLAKHLAEPTGTFWERAARYHSVSAEPNQRYQSIIRPLAARWAQKLRRLYPSTALAPIDIRGIN